jgi:hypothetical protein
MGHVCGNRWLRSGLFLCIHCTVSAHIPPTDIFISAVCRLFYDTAVLHHLSTVDRRYAVISELVRITKPGGVIMIQAWALEQGSDSKRTFGSQDTMVPWRLSKRFLSEEQQQQLLGGSAVATPAPSSGVADERQTSLETDTGDRSANPDSATTAGEGKDTSLPSTDSGRCQHVTEDSGELVFQRYCHVYKEGELEALCSSVPGCVVVESGWDKGNWFVQLKKVDEERVRSLPRGPESKIPVLATRTNH